MSGRGVRLNGRNAWWLFLSLAVVALDQLTKHWVSTHFYLFQNVRLTGFLNFIYVRNTGVAFSLFTHESRLVFIAIGLLIALVIVGWLLFYPRRATLTAAALSLVLGGALGNVVDRVRLGYVIDFIDFHVGHWHWPAFNVADSAVTIGALLLAFEALRAREPSDRNGTDS